MKNTILASLFLLSISNVFGTHIYRDDISSIKYGKCRLNTANLIYQTNTLGSPYCITISNHSKEPIIVNASLVVNPMYSLNEIAQAIRYESGVVTSLATLATLGFGYLSYLDRPLPKKVTEGMYFLLGGPSGTILLGSFTSYLLYRLIRVTAQLKKEVLYSPITIQPGKSVKKLFWLRNPKDKVSVNFDAIKVLK